MRHKYRLWTALVTLMIGLVVVPFATVSAAAQHNSLAQGFQVDNSEGNVVSGALVSLKQHSVDVVQLASTANAGTLLGVADSKALVTFSQGDEQAQVVLNGATSALVSDINGVVHNGDKITASPIAGVGMKATQSGQVVGTATSDASGGEKMSITDKQGGRHNVRLTRVSLQVNVGHYDAPNSDLLPASVQNIANGIAGRDVALIRVLIALVLLSIGFASVLIIVFVSVRSSITAIGRNPMASPDIRRGLHEILIISFIVALATIILSFLAIRL